MLAEPISRIVFVNDQHGLHLRPCSAIVTIVSRHQAKVTVHQGGHAVNADSIFGLLSLAATPLFPARRDCGAYGLSEVFGSITVGEAVLFC